MMQRCGTPDHSDRSDSRRGGPRRFHTVGDLSSDPSRADLFSDSMLHPPSGSSFGRRTPGDSGSRGQLGEYYGAPQGGSYGPEQGDSSRRNLAAGAFRSGSSGQLDLNGSVPEIVYEDSGAADAVDDEMLDSVSTRLSPPRPRGVADSPETTGNHVASDAKGQPSQTDPGCGHLPDESQCGLPELEESESSAADANLTNSRSSLASEPVLAGRVDQPKFTHIVEDRAHEAIPRVALRPPPLQLNKGHHQGHLLQTVMDVEYCASDLQSMEMSEGSNRSRRSVPCRGLEAIRALGPLSLPQAATELRSAYPVSGGRFDALPPGWELRESRSQPGVTYFFHRPTGRTSVDHPATMSPRTPTSLTGRATARGPPRRMTTYSEGSITVPLTERSLQDHARWTSPRGTAYIAYDRSPQMRYR